MTVADDLFACITKGDVDGVKAIYAPDAKIWHNFDGVEQNVEQNLQVLGWMARSFTERSYDDVRRQEWETGFVQQHVLRVTKPDGTVVAIPACIVAEVSDGKITRIDEYLDSAQTAQLMG